MTDTASSIGWPENEQQLNCSCALSMDFPSFHMLSDVFVVSEATEIPTKLNYWQTLKFSHWYIPDQRPSQQHSYKDSPMSLLHISSNIIINQRLQVIGQESHLAHSLKVSVIRGCMEICKNDIGKQCRPRSDATNVASDQGLHC